LILVIGIVAVVVLGLDLITKIVTEGILHTPLIPGVLSFQYTQNPGASFGLFGEAEWAHVFFIVLSFLFIAGFFVFNFMFNKDLKGKVYSVGCGLLIGGIVGNLIDRLAFGYVRDFIRFDFMNFPIFNIADIALTFGVILIFVWMLFIMPKKQKEAKNRIANLDKQADVFEGEKKERGESIWDSKE